MTALITCHMTVLPDWIDYNGHMTESRYLFATSETADAFLALIGSDLAYVKTGFSYYTAETFIQHLGEAKLGDALQGTLQILMADAKRVHIFVTLTVAGKTVATVEQMILHVDAAQGRVVPAPGPIQARLLPLAASHATLPRPVTAGRFVGQRG
jgi:carnitine 3-dehydrogenase